MVDSVVVTQLHIMSIKVHQYMAMEAAPQTLRWWLHPTKVH